MHKRIQYLDLIKVISIFLVVFCHFVLLGETNAANLCMVACWAGVPMFFMVNGALLFTRPLRLKKHFIKTLSIYGILVLWKFIYLLFISGVNHVDLSGYYLSDYFAYLFCFADLGGIIVGHLWFIEALLCVYILFPLFRIASDHPKGPAILLCFAGYAIFMTNGLQGISMGLNWLSGHGLTRSFSISGLTALNPLGTYANMLAFFLFGAWLHTAKTAFGSVGKQRILGAVFTAAGLAGMFLVKWYTSGTPMWDGVLLAEGYRHLPVIFVAAGIFLICKDITWNNRFLKSVITFTASRTLGIYYVHWLFGWLLVPYMALLFPSYNIWTNILKTLALILPSLLLTFIIEKIPLLRHLVTG